MNKEPETYEEKEIKNYILSIDEADEYDKLIFYFGKNLFYYWY